jgi:hypothetical protein
LRIVADPTVVYDYFMLASVGRAEETMSQDSNPDAKSPTGLAAAANGILEDAKAEPIPEKLVELAEKLESTLAERRLKDKGATKVR